MTCCAHMSLSYASLEYPLRSLASSLWKVRLGVKLSAMAQLVWSLPHLSCLDSTWLSLFVSQYQWDNASMPYKIYLILFAGWKVYRWYKTKLSYLQNLSFEKMPFISYEVSLKSSKSKIFSYKHIVWLLLVIFKYTFSFSNTACLI